MANGDDKRVASARNKASGLPTPPPLPRPNSHETPSPKARFLDGTPAAKTNVQGTPYAPLRGRK
jgi:hypothetical protein